MGSLGLTVLAWLVLAAGCDDGTSRPGGGSQSAQEDATAAREFFVAVDRYRVRAIPMRDEALTRAYERERACPDLVRPSAGRRLRIRVALAEETINQFTADQAVAQEFRELAIELSSISTRSPLLRTVATEAKQAAERAEKLEEANLDLCRLLEDWKRTGWSKGYERKLRDGYALFGVDSRAVAEAHRKVGGPLIPQLEQLGLTQQQALTIVSLAGAF